MGTHVDASWLGFTDAGSIPAASTWVEERRVVLLTRVPMTTDTEVREKWRELFQGGVTEDKLQQAERLIGLLRPTNPLRHNYSQQIDELRRNLHKPKPKRRVAC